VRVVPAVAAVRCQRAANTANAPLAPPIRHAACVGPTPRPAMKSSTHPQGRNSWHPTTTLRIVLSSLPCGSVASRNSSSTALDAHSLTCPSRRQDRRLNGGRRGSPERRSSARTTRRGRGRAPSSPGQCPLPSLLMCTGHSRTTPSPW